MDQRSGGGFYFWSFVEHRDNLGHNGEIEMTKGVTFRPGEYVDVKGLRYQVAAVNFDGKMILRPAHIKESTMDMMVRLQSTEPGDSTVRVEAPVQEPPEP